MLTIFGQHKSGGFCDGLSRRDFLRVGGLALGGLSMPQLLAADAESGVKKSHKAIIMVFLAGGPPHQDMWDIKTEAPSDIRGPFDPINTNVRGIQIGELFPKIARMADKMVFIRSIVGARGGHDAYQCMHGRNSGQQVPGGWPYIGSTISHLQGPVTPSVPPAIGLSPKTSHGPWGYNGKAGFLGPAHAPITPEGGQIQQDMVLKDISLDRLRDRRALLNSFDRFRRSAERTGSMEGLDAFNRQAMGILTSTKLAEAFDLSKEDPKLVARYGKGTKKATADGPWKRLDQFLLARRLVEAGARCVTLAFSRWDWHGNNFGRARQDMPMLDQGVSALVQDLHNRGLDKDVSVVVWGEFGRTPKINAKGGRDHWPQVSCALMAGGGMRTGQVIGSTNRLGEHAKDRPVHFQNVHATLYHNMGINVEGATVPDLSGRPRHIVDAGYKPLQELI
jgi:hypothetical protein